MWTPARRFYATASASRLALRRGLYFLAFFLAADFLDFAGAFLAAFFFAALAIVFTFQMSAEGANRSRRFNEYIHHKLICLRIATGERSLLVRSDAFAVRPDVSSARSKVAESALTRDHVALVEHSTSERNHREKQMLQRIHVCTKTPPRTRATTSHSDSADRARGCSRRSRVLHLRLLSRCRMVWKRFRIRVRSVARRSSAATKGCVRGARLPKRRYAERLCDACCCWLRAFQERAFTLRFTV